jgi:hypothetical protein
VYKGRKKKTIEYYAIKSVDKSQKSKVLQEVSSWKIFSIFLKRFVASFAGFFVAH